MNSPEQNTKQDEYAANVIRMLAADAVQQADSGHPGLPMGAADIAYVLWTKFLRFDPDDPSWINRDRFVLSAGHGSMLLYALLHLSGYDLSLDDLKHFRQLGSRTPGHPEYRVTPGVETTTGPLGQGFANAVGMAMAAKMYAARFNTAGFTLIDHNVYAIAGDGDLMEGVSSEAASLAGHLRLGNLIVIYDDNKITIEGATYLAFSENVAQRFQAYGWQTVSVDGHNQSEIAAALRAARAEKEKPSLIIARTVIGFGSPGKAGTADVHGAPLGADNVAAARKELELPPDKPFFIPDEVRALFTAHADRGREEHRIWKEARDAWAAANPRLAGLWQQLKKPQVPDDLDLQLLAATGEPPAATRSIGGEVLQKAAELFPGLLGGSADLAPSTKTLIKNASSVGPFSFEGKNIHFGVREHAMGAILNGLSLYGGFIPYGSTFFVFADYLRPALRLSALMKLQVIYIFTHDSLFVGEDGPTHQPVEQLASLRAIPNLTVFRPADRVETAASFGFALRNRRGPTAICLTRQKTGTISPPAECNLVQVSRGGYIVKHEKEGDIDIVLVGTGSELALAVQTADRLEKDGKNVRVVSMPSLDLFMARTPAEREAVVPQDHVPVAVLEAGIKQGWGELTRGPLLFLGMEQFGESAPADKLAEKYGFNVASAHARISSWLQQQ